jgi:aspartate-semialdehyde dehydrogenase
VVLKDNIESNEYPMPFEITGSDWTYVGRIREDKSFPNSFNCWIVADNIRRGAAANAVEILAELINQGEQNVK